MLKAPKLKSIIKTKNFIQPFIEINPPSLGEIRNGTKNKVKNHVKDSEMSERDKSSGEKFWKTKKTKHKKVLDMLLNRSYTNS